MKTVMETIKEQFEAKGEKVVIVHSKSECQETSYEQFIQELSEIQWLDLDIV